MNNHKQKIDSDFRKLKTKKKEDEFICGLQSNNTLYMLANEILFNYIQIALHNGLTEKDIINIIEIEILYKSDSKKQQGYSRIKTPSFSLKAPLITKNGYDCDNYNCYKILTFKNYKQLTNYNKKHNISFLQITSAYYKFAINNIMFSNIIKKDTILKKKVVDSFNTYFIVNYTFEEIDKIVNKSKGSWFYTWLLVFLDSNIKNLMHRNSNEDEDYIRKWAFTLNKKDIVSSPQKQITCGFKNDYPYAYDVMKGNTYMKPVNNSIWWNTMKNNKKQIISGFSSSAVLCYNSIFNMTKMLSKTKKNKVLVLCLVLADYHNIHHSMSEVLSMYTVDAKLPIYKLNMNDLTYVKNLIKKYTKLNVSTKNKTHKTYKIKHKMTQKKKYKSKFSK
jgi:hypothetical protein